jgi:monovalent cation:H+ antiporter-2, CPA2 family
MAGAFDSAAFRDALVILGASGFVIPAFHRLRISPIIGFVLVGLMLGPSGLGALEASAPWLRYLTISDYEAIAPIAEFGVVLLLFSIGLELSVGRLWQLRGQVFLLGPAEMLGSALLIGGALVALGTPLSTSVALGLALALSSTALVLPMTGTKSRIGRPAFAMLLFEDLAIVPIIFVLGVLGPMRAGGGDSLAEVLFGGGLAVAAILVVGRYVLPRFLRLAARTKTPEAFIAVSLVTVMAASVATVATGLSPIIGALVAGMAIAETEYRQQVEATVEPFKNLALGVFMITIGLSIDVAMITERWPQIILATVGVILIKALVTGVLLRLSGARRGVAANIGILMASPSETTLIVLAAAVAAQILDAETAAFWQVVTALGLTATPLLARIGRDAARRVDPEPPATAAAIAEPRTIVVGYGRVGQLVTAMLAHHQQPFVVVEADPDAVRIGRKRGHDVVYGDIARPELVKHLNLGAARSIVLTMDDPVQLVRTTRAVRAENPNLCIVSRARDAEHAAELYRAGATDAVPETLESSLQLAEAVLVDIGRPMGPVIASIHEMRENERRKIKNMVPELDREPFRATSRLRRDISPPQ